MNPLTAFIRFLQSPAPHEPSHYEPFAPPPPPPPDVPPDVPPNNLPHVSSIPGHKGQAYITEEISRARENAARLDALREAEIAVLKTGILSLSINPGVLAREMAEAIRRLRNV